MSGKRVLFVSNIKDFPITIRDLIDTGGIVINEKTGAMEVGENPIVAESKFPISDPRHVLTTGKKPKHIIPQIPKPPIEG